MRTSIELPDKLLIRAKSRAASQGISLKEFFIDALEEKLAPPARKVCRPPPLLSTGGQPIPNLTSEQIEEAMFGSINEALPG